MTNQIFNTSQERVVVPTNELISKKGTDFRVILAISTISNVNLHTKEGDNTRYLTLSKFNREKKRICEAIGISESQLRKHINTLAKCGSEEFKLIEREYVDGEKEWVYEINYKAGEFVTIPYDKVERLIAGLSNNCIKLYSNLLWICRNKRTGELEEKAITQDYLMKHMGLSSTSNKLLKIAVETLEKVGLIEVRKEMISESIIVNGEMKGKKPKTTIYYSISE